MTEKQRSGCRNLPLTQMVEDDNIQAMADDIEQRLIHCLDQTIFKSRDFAAFLWAGRQYNLVVHAD